MSLAFVLSCLPRNAAALLLYSVSSFMAPESPVLTVFTKNNDEKYLRNFDSLLDSRFFLSPGHTIWEEAQMFDRGMRWLSTVNIK